MPQELRFASEMASGIILPSSIRRPSRRQVCRPIVISVCMSASFFWTSWRDDSGRPNSMRSPT